MSLVRYHDHSKHCTTGQTDRETSRQCQKELFTDNVKPIKAISKEETTQELKNLLVNVNMKFEVQTKRTKEIDLQTMHSVMYG